MAWEKAKPQGKSGGGKLVSVQTDGGKGIPPGVPSKSWSERKPKGGPIDSFASESNSKGAISGKKK